MSAVFERDVEIVERLNDARRRLSDANEGLWSGLLPDAFGVLYDGAAPAGQSAIAALMSDALSSGRPEAQTAVLGALQQAHWTTPDTQALVGRRNVKTLVGIAWFVTSRSTDSTGGLSATLAKQGYVGVNKEDVLFPSIGVTPSGRATIAFTLAGPDYRSSAAWAPLSLSSGAGPVYIAAAGKNADDDFSAVKAYGGDGVGRWGDYTAAVSDTSGNVWMGVEYVSGVERTPLANWATFLFHVSP